MSALISADGLYRYKLERKWRCGNTLAFVMLNPSTADAEADDPTIRRCISFARDAGYGSIVVGNLFAWRATNSGELKKIADPVGPENDIVLREIILCSTTVLCAWGTKGSQLGRDQFVLGMIRDAGKIPHSLRLTRDGYPCHPLYLPATLRPSPMNV